MIRLTQALCPKRHAAFALAWDDAAATVTETEQKIAEMLAVLRAELGGHLGPNCGICGQPWKLEHGQTMYRTMEEAGPHLAHLAMQQIARRFVLDALGLTHEKMDPTAAMLSARLASEAAALGRCVHELPRGTCALCKTYDTALRNNQN